MLGISQTSKDVEAVLPDPLTEDKSNSLVERGEDREARLKKAIDRAMRRYINKPSKIKMPISLPTHLRLSEQKRIPQNN